MANFRNKTPARRNIIAAVNKYSDHKPNLKIDFDSRCGYCDAPDSWKTTFYEVDHFIPYKRNKVVFLTIKALTDYSNLVYSCRSCNNSKRNKWPTNDENIPYANNEGFIDPCLAQYEQQFQRNNIGEIIPVTDLGRWMFKALQLHKPQHQIIWQLEQLEPIIAAISASDKIDTLPEHIKDKIIALLLKYVNYSGQLKNL